MTSSVLVRYDTSPIGTGKNWVTHTDPVEGLGSFVRAVVHALMRNGHSEQEAIAIALGVMKRWAAGKGTNSRQKHVTAATQAKAAAAVAHWDELKAKAHTRASGGAATGGWVNGHPFYGNQHIPDPNAASNNQYANPGSGPNSAAGLNAAANALPQPPSSATGSAAKGAGAQAWSMQQQLVQQVGQAQKAYDSAKKAFDQATRAAAVAQLNYDNYQKQSAQNLEFAKERLVNTPKGVQNLQAFEQMQTTTQDQLASLKLALDNANANVSDSQDSLNLAQGQLLYAMQQAGFRSIEDAEIIFIRDFVGEGNPAGVGDSSGASNFLPAGPSKKKSKAITDSMEEVVQHRFAGTDLMSCGECQRPINAAVHRRTGAAQPIAPAPRQRRYAIADLLPAEMAPFVRHRGHGHDAVPTGHVKQVPARHKKAAAARNMRHFAAVEEPMTTSLQHLFADQRTSTLNRLMGKRGGQMLKRAVAALSVRDDSNQADNSEPLPLDSAQIFDPAYWTAKTADVIQPHLAHAGSLATGEVDQQLGISPGDGPSGPGQGTGGPGGTVPPGSPQDGQIWPGGSPALVQGVVAQRAQAAAQHVTTTTGDALQAALQAGVEAGEGRDAIAKRVNEVFDHADMDRAKLIAQTETVGAYNEAQSQYANSLPKGTVGSHVWLAHHDARTRPTHRVADTQERPTTAPFLVGGAPMMYPGDKAAPISEWINCRCSQAFLPPGMTYAPLQAAAQEYMAGLHAAPPKVESPYNVEGSKGTA